MSNRIWLLLVVVALVSMGLGAGVGVLGWNAITAGSGEASEEISAPTLDINAAPTFSQTQAAALAEENEELRQQLSALSTQVAQMEPAADVTPEPETNNPASAQNTGESPPSNRTLFRITPDESEVRFLIEETLRGQRITVVGRTNQVAGDVLVDFSQPVSSRVGTVRINVRTLATDNNFRNEAIRSRILQSSRDEFEFAEFVPTAVEGLPQTVTVGETVEFQIIGDLTITGTTRTVTFDTTVTVVDEGRLEGLASTNVTRQDYNLNIPPNVPGVADVAEDVVLEIEFVALAVEDV